MRWVWNCWYDDGMPSADRQTVRGNGQRSVGRKGPKGQGQGAGEKKGAKGAKHRHPSRGGKKKRKWRPQDSSVPLLALISRPKDTTDRKHTPRYHGTKRSSPNSDHPHFPCLPSAQALCPGNIGKRADRHLHSTGCQFLTVPCILHFSTLHASTCFTCIA